MVPGLTERACRASELQSREWLAEALRDAAQRDSAVVSPRSFHRTWRAPVRHLAAVGGRACRHAVASLTAAFVSWRRTERLSSPTAGANSSYPRSADRIGPEAV